MRESFPDGVVVIYDNENKNGIGNIPRDKLKERCKLRFREKTVGIQRFYQALQDNARIERILRCPRRNDVSVLDVVNIASSGTGDHYRIQQIQYPDNVSPSVMDISLERVDVQ